MGHLFSKEMFQMGHLFLADDRTQRYFIISTFPHLSSTSSWHPILFSGNFYLSPQTLRACPTGIKEMFFEIVRFHTSPFLQITHPTLSLSSVIFLPHECCGDSTRASIRSVSLHLYTANCAFGWPTLAMKRQYQPMLASHDQYWTILATPILPIV